MTVALGTQDDALWLLDKPIHDKHEVMGLMKDAGVTWIRSMLQYDVVRPIGSAKYDFSKYDELLRLCEEYGMNVHFTVFGAPSWTRTLGEFALSYKNPDPQRFYAFMRLCVNRYHGRVKRWGLWNEPNLPTFIYDRKNAGKICNDLYRVGYKAVKTEDPKAEVIIGETAGAVTLPFATFIKDLVVDGALIADGYAHHGYQYDISPWQTYKPGATGMGQLEDVVKTLKLHPRLKTPTGHTLPLHITEHGYHPSQPNRPKWWRESIDKANKLGVKTMHYYHAVETKQMPWQEKPPWNTGMIPQKWDGPPGAMFEAFYRYR